MNSTSNSFVNSVFSNREQSGGCHQHCSGMLLTKGCETWLLIRPNKY